MPPIITASSPRRWRRREKRIFIVGWDFDTRIALAPDEHGKGETLGRFFLRLAQGQARARRSTSSSGISARSSSSSDAAAIMWLCALVADQGDRLPLRSLAPGRAAAITRRSSSSTTRLAACGGIDISTAPLGHAAIISTTIRTAPAPTASPICPWHDATMLMRGDVAERAWRARPRAVEGRDAAPNSTRSSRATTIGPTSSSRCSATSTSPSPAPAPPMTDLPEVREIEALLPRHDRRGEALHLFRESIFHERQDRRRDRQAHGRARPARNRAWSCRAPPTAGSSRRRWTRARLKLVAAIGKVDKHDRFRVYVPVTKGGTDIYVHAKVSIVDDRLLRVGSSNLNNRSQGLDSECDVIIDAALAANRGSEPAMTALRHRLIAEHLGCAPRKWRRAKKARRIDDRRRSRRCAGAARRSSCSRWKSSARSRISSPTNEVLDPESAEEMFEPIGKHGMAQSWAKGRAMIEAAVADSGRRRTGESTAGARPRRRPKP